MRGTNFRWQPGRRGVRDQGTQSESTNLFSFKYYLTERILAFNQETAKLYSQIAANRKQIGRPISQFDAQIAAICRVHQATLATRNIRDFLDCGIDLINPWQQP